MYIGTSDIHLTSNSSSSSIATSIEVSSVSFILLQRTCESINILDMNSNHYHTEGNINFKREKINEFGEYSYYY